MKGIILAGGTGSRLFPSTKVTNKHLLPIFNKPMIYYPIDTLKRSGIRDILIVTGAEHAGDFMALLGSGSDLGVSFTYRIQDGSGGIAQALSLAEDFAAGDSIAVVLSDNIFEDDFSEDVYYFDHGAKIFVKRVEDAARFGVVDIDEDGNVKSIEEKPALPKSNLAQSGFYLYDNQVFDFIRTLEPSKRGELEITDVNKIYLHKNMLQAAEISGMWIDAGTHESLLEAGILAQEAFDPERVRARRPDLAKTKFSHHMARITVGVITHNSEDYLEPCLNSLLAQDYENMEIVVLDNDSEDHTIDALEEKFPDIKFIESQENLGFAKSHNEILRQSECDFYACVNIDMIFEPNFVSELVKSIEQKPIFGSSGGKVKRWDFEAYQKSLKGARELGKTNFIDSAGIRILKSHRFEDMGQGDVDYGQYDHPREIFGVSGAAVLYRRKALEDVAFLNENGEKEYFDESMFMYKEDIDLAYRFQWAGWKCHYTPHAVAYHDRTIPAIGRRALDIVRNRSRKSTFVNRLSYLNHQILLEKNFSDEYSSKVRGATFWYNLKVFLYILVFETELLSEWWRYYKMRGKIKARKRAMPRRVSKAEIEKLMESGEEYGVSGI
ncbi:glycosyltransferase family 2 protein [Candidatus Gracilibacteria bacterium]|nr:glycosyltransferase family 2 protein [Candidatus Gracilibacteria bacterium]